MIGLPEYRNGGLLVDLGLLSLTDKAKSEAISESEGIYKFSPSSQTVIEWRAITVIALYVFFLFLLDIYLLPHPALNLDRSANEEKLTTRDKIAAGLRTKLDFNFTLPQVLESATWKCGRLIAAEKRTNGGPPIEIESDGTIF
jgi:hypothetical protein